MDSRGYEHGGDAMAYASTDTTHEDPMFVPEDSILPMSLVREQAAISDDAVFALEGLYKAAAQQPWVWRLSALDEVPTRTDLDSARWYGRQNRWTRGLLVQAAVMEMLGMDATPAFGVDAVCEMLRLSFAGVVVGQPMPNPVLASRPSCCPTQYLHVWERMEGLTPSRGEDPDTHPSGPHPGLQVVPRRRRTGVDKTLDAQQPSSGGDLESAVWTPTESRAPASKQQQPSECCSGAALSLPNADVTFEELIRAGLDMIVDVRPSAPKRSLNGPDGPYSPIDSTPIVSRPTPSVVVEQQGEPRRRFTKAQYPNHRGVPPRSVLDKCRTMDEKMQAVFHLPINEAAKALNMGVTVLKKVCREKGIQRWPYRKLSSITKLIDSISAVLESDPDQISDPETDESARCAYNKLVELRKSIFDDPTQDLDDWAKKLRQANFKQQYKLRQDCCSRDLGHSVPLGLYNEQSSN